ncbi:MAG: CpaF family protein [Pseudomonadota bacterium]
MAGRFSRFAEPGVDAPALAEAPAPRAAPKREASTAQSRLIDARVALHRHLVDKINLSVLDQIEHTDLIAEITPLVQDYVRQNAIALSGPEIEQLVRDTADEMMGLGPIEPLLKDRTVSDILINGPNRIFVERGGRLEETPNRFRDEAHLMRIIQRIVSAVGRRVDESVPMADARLADGSRVNVAVRPITIDGPLVSIRKFSVDKISLDELVEFKSMTPQMAELLAIAVRGKTSIVISGGTGSGKTTMLNALSSKIDHAERLITIEDAAELQLQQPHVARMETRPPNIEGSGEIRQRELLKNALRMRPDRIIVGEVRGEEAFDMLQAMNTGHEGSMTTIHANTPRDALSRLELMIGMAGMPMTQESIRGQIASSVGMIIQANRLHDGSRRVTSIAEIVGMEGSVVQMQEIFRYEVSHTDESGRIIGQHRPTGVRPRLLERLSGYSLTMSAEAFEPNLPRPT